MQDENTEAITISSRHKLPALTAGISGLVLMMIAITKDPSSGGPLLILLFLATAFVWVLSLSCVLLQFIFNFFLKRNISLVRHLYTSVALSAGFVFLIGLRTLGQLQLADVILMVVFQALLNFYLLRRF